MGIGWCNDCQDKDGWSASHYAVQKVNVLKWIYDHNIKLTIITNQESGSVPGGASALHKACIDKKGDAVEFLLAATDKSFINHKADVRRKEEKFEKLWFNLLLYS